MKIAIVGGGISGLVTAHHLVREHDVTLLEANDYVGGHTHTVDVERFGRSWQIDTGFIVFNDRNYPNFVQLLNDLGVPSQPTSMSFSVRDDRTGLEYNGNSLTSLFCQRRNLWSPRFYRLLFDILRFNRVARRVAEDASADETVGQFLQAGRYSRQFCEQYLLPMGAAIWSCPMGTFAEFPIRFIAEFYRNHGLLDLWGRPQWRVIQGGSRVYVQRLVESWTQRIRTSCPVSRVQRDSEGMLVTSPLGTERFDHVVFACHSDQALRMLGADATPVEREVLSAFPYEKNVAVLHTDVRMLPERRSAWASWNYLVTSAGAGGPKATVTYNMNILQGLTSDPPFCVTLNPEQPIAPDQVLGQYEYAHPIFTTQRHAMQARHQELVNSQRASFCGAYWGNGFHEDGVKSALAVVTALSSDKSSSLKPSAGLVANVVGSAVRADKSAVDEDAANESHRQPARSPSTGRPAVGEGVSV
jgi:uncharacterized protein